MLDTDLEGLGPPEATEYVLAFITTLKQTEKARAAADEEAALWARRVELARSKGEEALASQAQVRLDQSTAKRAQLDAELADLKGKVSILKEKLARLRMTGGKSIDTDLLLAQLEMAVGKKDELSKTFKDEESNAALDELKKKMGR
ncbi:MAG TPA: chromosome partitioning protein [Spirochaetia bacterium]|nr:chromosome partitioning protein [Spirochaetia bacterium]